MISRTPRRAGTGDMSGSSPVDCRPASREKGRFGSWCIVVARKARLALRSYFVNLRHHWEKFSTDGLLLGVDGERPPPPPRRGAKENEERPQLSVIQWQDLMHEEGVH